MNWTDERVKLLEVLWNDGLSASQIAAQLGDGISRNAVIGKVHRLKLTGRGRASANVSAQNKKGVSKVVADPVNVVEDLIQETVVIDDALLVEENFILGDDLEQDVLPPQARKLSLLQLSESTCKWPMGDPLSENFYFCGADVGAQAPYCSYHSKIAYQSFSERKRHR